MVPSDRTMLWTRTFAGLRPVYKASPKRGGVTQKTSTKEELCDTDRWEGMGPRQPAVEELQRRRRGQSRERNTAGRWRPRMTTAEFTAPPPPRVRLSLGVTGHRAGHAVYAQNAARIEACVRAVLDVIAGAVDAEPQPFGPGSIAPTRLHSMLADGADQLLAREALARGWELIAPLPFGADLNCAINCAPLTAADARSLMAAGGASEAQVAARAHAIRTLTAQARLFELADDDEEIAEVFLDALENPERASAREIFAADSSERVALAARLVIEQSDLVIAVWDGARATFVGGTGHTIAQALHLGAPVVWIDPASPEGWRILRAPEALASLRTTSVDPHRMEHVRALTREALRPAEPGAGSHHHRGGSPGVSALDAAHWQPRSNRVWHLYRRVEALFGGDKTRNPWRSLRATYEGHETIAQGSGAPVLAASRAVLGGDDAFTQEIAASVLSRFAWADGISSRLSDTYRGGMMINFLLSSFAIVGGIAYLPLADYQLKWAFALFEFALLSLILIITFQGQKRRWHARWFETRRVAEYLRHAPLLLTLGAARAPGRWPKGAETSWPEWYARHALREVGLPRVKVTPGYLRAALDTLLDTHVTQQRNYHQAKAKRLAAVHHNLDTLSEWMFRIAVVSVAIYLGLQGAVWLKMFDKAALKEFSKVFTFLGVLLPTFGGTIAGIRYFGDFERFAAISEVTAQKLDSVHARIALLVNTPDANMDYGPVAEIAHAADDIVFSEIENWQAVFGGKHITVPV